MNFKYCYKDEIHKSFKIPPTLEALIQDITASFKTKLPPNFNIRYKDMDGDFITISSDVEYHSMLKFDTPANTRTSFKLFIVSPRDNATDEKEPSFEVIDSGNNTSQGGISEFSLTSKDCEEIPTERPSTSSQKDDNNTSTTERDRAPANSLQRSRVLNDTSDWKDEQLSFPDGEEESVSFGDETFNHAYKPVVSSPRQELVSPSLSGDSDMKVSLGREQQENSLEKIFDKMQPLDCRSIDFKEEEVNRSKSKENSIVLREIDNFMDKLVEQKKEMVPGSSDAAEIKPMFNAQRIMPLDLFDRRRREKIMKIKNRSARIIQRAFRTHQLQKEFDKFRMEHRVSTQEAVVGLTNLIKARLQALIEAQLPIQPVHQTFEPTHITPQEVSFERRRMPWEPETTEPHCYSFEKSATEERCMEEASLPHISRDCLICGDLRYCEHITDNDNNNNDDDEGYYRACSDNNLSLHDSRVESPYLDDLLNQSNSQVVEDTRLELPVIESKPVQSFGYRVMLGMSSSLLFLGGEEGQGVVYKTIYLENTGPKPWRKCYVKSVGLIEGKTLEFYNVDVGEISLVTLELNGYFTAGTYSSQWRLIHENEHGMMEPIGDAFEIEFMIESQNIINTLESLLPRKFTEEYPSQDFIYKYLAHDEEEEEATERYRDSFRDRTEDEQEPEEEREMEEEQEEEYEDEEEEEYEDEEEEEEEEQYEDEDEEEEYYDEEEEYEEEEEEEFEDEEEEEYEEEEEEEEEEEYEERDEDREKEERFKKYIDYKDEIYKIREMRKIFPLESLDELIEFVDNRPQLTVEELLIGYLAMKNKY